MHCLVQKCRHGSDYVLEWVINLRGSVLDERKLRSFYNQKMTYLINEADTYETYNVSQLVKSFNVDTDDVAWQGIVSILFSFQMAHTGVIASRVRSLSLPLAHAGLWRLWPGNGSDSKASLPT